MANVLFFANETVGPSHFVYWFNQGFAVLIVLALGWAFYGWIRWAGVNLALPLCKAHMSYLDAATDGIKTVLVNQTEHHNEIKKIANTVGRLEKTTQEIASDVDILKSRQA